MNILHYLEVILEDQAILYALLRSMEDRLTASDGTEVPNYFETYQKDWLEETKRRLKEKEEIDAAYDSS